MVASTERWRSARRRSSAGTPARSSLSSSVGVRLSVRAAASSMASGRPSRTLTISAIAGVIAGRRGETWMHRGRAIDGTAGWPRR